MNINTQYLAANRDTFNNLRVIPFTANDLVLKEELAKQDPLGKETENVPFDRCLLKDKRIHGVRPTEKKWRRETILGHVAAFFEQIAHLLSKLWPKRPTHIDQALFAALQADQTLGKISEFSLAPLNLVLQYAIQFLEKERKTPALSKLLKKFKQCAKWSETVERLKTDLNSVRCAKELQGLSREISKRIKKLKTGESCLIPGGSEDCQILYEVTRSADKNYRLRLISRDSAFGDTTVLSSAGKLKIYPDTTFHSIKEGEIADPIFLETLLDLQLSNLAKAQSTNINESMSSLLFSFRDRLEERSKDPQDYRTSAQSKSQAKNVMVLIDEVLNPSKRKSAPAQRRKLKLKLASFFEFYEVSRKTLSTNSTNQLLLGQGLERINRLASLMHSRGQLSKVEITELNRDFQVIEKALKAAKTSQPEKKNQGLKIPPPHHFEPFQEKLVSFTENEKLLTAPLINPRAEIAELPMEKLAEKISCPFNRSFLPEFHPNTIAGTLKNLRESCDELLQKEQYDVLQERLTQIISKLEFDPVIGERYGERQIRNNDFWAQISENNRIKCGHEIMQLSQLLEQSMNKTPPVMRSRLFAILKATFIMDRLTRLNSKTTLLEDHKSFEILKDLLNSLYQGIEEDYELQTLSKHIYSDYLDFYFHSSYKWRNENSVISAFYYYNHYDGYLHLFKKRQIPDQVNDLTKQFSLLRKIWSLKQHKSSEGINWDYLSPENQQRMASPWIRAFENGYLRAAAVHGKLNTINFGGEEKYIRNPDAFTGSLKELAETHPTQESIIDNPLRVLKGFKSVVKYEPEMAPYTLPKLPKGDLSDLLLLLQPEMTIIEAIGLFKEKHHLLDIGDIRSFCDHTIFRFEALKNSFENMPLHTIDLFADTLNEMIELLRIQGKTAPCLFLINLNQRAKAIAETIPKCQDSRGMFKDYLPRLNEWAELANDSENPYSRYRFSIWTLLLSQNQGDVLSINSIRELAIGYTVIHSTSKSLFDPNPLVQEEIERKRVRWDETIKQQMSTSEEFKQSTLDKTCVACGYSLPEAKWKGEYPIYHADNYQIDLRKGTFFFASDSSKLGILPDELLLADSVKKAFTSESLEKLSFQSYELKNGNAYFFKDSQGIQNRIAKQSNEIVIHKSFNIQNKQKWLQFVDQDTLFPDAEPKLPDLAKSLFSNVWKVYIWYKKFKKYDEERATFPLFLKNPAYRFWIDPQHPTDVYVFNEKGMPLFQLIFREKNKQRTLEEIIDLRPDASREKRQVGPLDPLTRSDWKVLKEVEDPQQIMVWKKEKKIERVELPRFGLNFVEKNGKIVCTDPRLKDWILETQSSIRANKGLPQALLFSHPTISNKKRLIVPNQPIVTSFAQSSNKDVVWKMLKAFVFKRRDRTVVTDSLKDFCKFDRKAPHQEFWIFDLDPNTNELVESSSRQSAKAYNYLAQAATANFQYQHALEYLLQSEKSENDLPFAKAMGQYKELLNLDIHDPDAIAIKLHACCIAYKKYPEKFDPTLLLELYKCYLVGINNTDTILKLKDEDEVKCLNLLKKYDPEFYAAHGPLIATFQTGEKRSVKASFSSRSFYPPQLLPKEKLSKFALELFENIKKKSKQNPLNPNVAHEFTTLTDNFLGLYQIARDAKIDSSEFRRLRYQLKIMTTDEKKAKENEFRYVLQDYLSAVIEARLQNKDLKKLPATPSLIWEDPTTLKAKESKKQEADSLLAEKNKKPFLKFCKDLEGFVETYRKMIPPPPVQAPFSPDLLALETLEKDIKKVLSFAGDEKQSKRIDQLSLEELEKQFKASVAVKLPGKLIENTGDPLFGKNDLLEYFDIKQRKAPPVPNLSELKQDKRKAVKVAAEKLEKELQTATKKMLSEKTPLLKNESGRLKLEKRVTSKLQKLASSVESRKNEIVQILYPQITALDGINNRGKLRKYVEWDRFVKHYLQQDLEALIPDLPKGVDIDLLKAKMLDYLKAATKSQRLSAALEEISLMHPEKNGVSTIASESLYASLTAERQYNVDKFPHLLLFEYLSGILLRKSQLEMVQDFVLDSNCIRQAHTGAGKTSVILILTALFKANGSNLSTVLFPKAIYESNLSYLENKLGKVFQRNVYPLRYRLQMAHKAQKKGADGKEEVESIFKGMYENLLRTILQKGVVASTVESMQALEQKWVNLLDKMSKLPRDAKNIPDLSGVDPIQRQHFYFLTRILHLLDTKQGIVIDEHDKALAPREERHLKIGQEKPLPPFIINTSLMIYDELLAVEKLGLRKNLQAELGPREVGDQARANILENVAQKIARDWAKQKRIPEANIAAFVTEFTDYIRGRDERVLERVKDWNLEEKDILALLKDQFSIFLPLTLSKSNNAQGSCTRSADGVRTVPCSYSDKPREEAEKDDIKEQINYTCQDYYHSGIRLSVLENWIKERKQGAAKEIEGKQVTNIDETVDGQLFRSLFPSYSLGNILDKDAEKLLVDVNTNPQKIKVFLTRALKEIKVSHQKISCDGYNLVSMTRNASGASATLGCLQGIHRKINVENAQTDGTNGKMILTLIRKTGSGKTTLFDPENPKGIIPKLSKGTLFHGVVDGAGALSDVSAEDAAKQLLKTHTDKKGLQGILFFDSQGKALVYTNHGVVSPEMTGLKPEQLGMALKEAESRGADFKIGQNAHFLVTANARQTLPDIVQACGRSRGEEQSLKLAVPKQSQLVSTEEIVKSGVINQATRGSDDLFKAKKQELRDIVRHEMMTELINEAMNESLNLFSRYDEFQSEQYKLLVSEKDDDMEKPGSYFEKHAHIERQDKEPLSVLMDLKRAYSTMAQNLGLRTAKSTLDKLSYPPELIKELPDTVFGLGTAQTDQEAEIEIDLDTDKDVDIDADIEIEKQNEVTEDAPWYLPWVQTYKRGADDDRYEIHSLKTLNAAYHEDITFTENFLPLHRKNWANKVWWRSPHDHIQNPVHQVVFKKITHKELDAKTWQYNKVARVEWKVQLLDVIEAGELTKSHYGNQWITDYRRDFLREDHEWMLYDLRTRKFVNDNQGTKLMPEIDPDMQKYLAQIRFFNGQYMNYTEVELFELKEWLKRHNPHEMEHYFVNTVLRFKPDDQQKYPFSPLRKLFTELKQQ